MFICFSMKINKKRIEQMSVKWFLLIYFIAPYVAFSQNTPCSGMKGVISHCLEGKYVCKDGSVSSSTATRADVNAPVNAENKSN